MFFLFFHYVLSLTWVVSNVFLSLAVSDIAEKMMKSNSDIQAPFVLTFFYSVCYLTIAIVINYYFTKFSLMKFVFLSHSFLLARLLWSVGVYYFLKRNNKL